MNQFQREDRYIVIKRKDLENVPASYRKDLVDPLPWLQVHLPSRKFLVIESDWPEYEPVWAMIEARISGTHVPPAGVQVEDLTVRNVMAACERASAQHLPETSNWCAALTEYLNNIGRARVTRLQAEVAALQQRLNVADQRVDELEAALKFYADKDHYHFDEPDKWDSVSGEAENLLWHEEDPAYIEDGSVARNALKVRP